MKLWEIDIYGTYDDENFFFIRKAIYPGAYAGCAMELARIGNPGCTLGGCKLVKE
jgi:hypothetical protein